MDAAWIRRSRVRGWAVGAVLAGTLLGGVVSESSRATQFDSPPGLGHRVVSLDWQPDADDPFFNGNTLLDIQRRLEFVHRPGQAVRLIRLENLTGRAYSYADGDDVIKQWRVADGAVLQELPLPVAEAPVDLTLHGSNAFLMASFPSGRIAIWDTRTSEPATVYPVSARTLQRAIFFGGSVDPRDLRIITAGVSDTVRVWTDPSTVLYNLRIPDGPTYALDVDRRGQWIVTAGAGGRARVWQLANPFTPRFRTEILHQAAIRDVQISLDGSRMVTSDESGQIRLWTFPNAVLIDSADTGASGVVRLEMSVPDGSVVSAHLPDGRLQLFDGKTLRFYREQQITEAAGTAFELAPDGTASAVGDANGVISIVRAGRCVPSLISPVCFGGYKIWRNTRPDAAGVQLLRVFGFADSTWSFVDDARTFVDPDSVILRTAPPGTEDPDDVEDGPALAGPHDGVSYFYSITRFDSHFLNGSIFDVYPRSIQEGFYRDPGSIAPTAIVPAASGRAELPHLDNVYVVPNPYDRGTVPWDAVGGAHVEFRNLPRHATIAIHTIAGDEVRVLEHAEDQYGESRFSERWDLRNSAGLEVASGIYVYQVTTPSGEVIQGYFAVIL